MKITKESSSESRRKMMESAGWTCIAPGIYIANNPPTRPSEDKDDITLRFERELEEFKKQKRLERNESNQTGGVEEETHVPRL